MNVLPLSLVAPAVAEMTCCTHVKSSEAGIGYLTSWKRQDGFRRRSGGDSIVLKYHTAVWRLHTLGHWGMSIPICIDVRANVLFAWHDFLCCWRQWWGQSCRCGSFMVVNLPEVLVAFAHTCKHTQTHSHTQPDDSNTPAAAGPNQMRHRATQK